VRRLLTEPAPTGVPPRSDFASFGEGSRIDPPAFVTGPSYIHIGEGVRIRRGAWLSVVAEHYDQTFTPTLKIGDRTVLGHDIVIACIGEVTIGKEVLTSDRVFIGDTYHEYQDPDTPVLYQPSAAPQPVHIGDGSFLGINSIVLPGVTVGERACVAAGAVVTEDVPPNTVVAGNPARIIRRWDPESRTWVKGES
jgi:acetyltransferase-like isoleucine patch superfamily enzyme